MSPGTLADACGEWSNQPTGSEITNLRFESAVLTRAADARFDWFLRQFLEHVSIPEELIRFTQGVYPQHVTSEAADWLRSFKFTGVVEFDADYPPQGRGRTVLAAISAPLCEVMVIRPPIEMLNALVSIKAQYWRRVASVARPDQVHHEPIGEWSFEPWIDLHVARACGFPIIGRAGMVPPIHLIQNVRGHVSIVGALPRDAAELSVLARAASLHLRSQSRGADLSKALRRK
jgi:hypothetical protein